MPNAFRRGNGGDRLTDRAMLIRRIVALTLATGVGWVVVPIVFPPWEVATLPAIAFESWMALATLLLVLGPYRLFLKKVKTRFGSVVGLVGLTALTCWAWWSPWVPSRDDAALGFVVLWPFGILEFAAVFVALFTDWLVGRVTRTGETAGDALPPST